MLRCFFLFFILALAGYVPTKAQYPNECLRRSVFVEFFGSSYTYSINYEHILYRDPSMAISGRIGAGYLPPKDYPNSWNTIFGLNLLLGTCPHYIETGIAYLSLKHDVSGKVKHYTNFYLGYRFQPKAKGLMFRAGLTPYYTPFEQKLFYEEIPITLYGGISAGFSF